MTGSLRALLTGLIDYAGLFPPASLPYPKVVENYSKYLVSADGWILNRLVLPASHLADAFLERNWRITVLVDSDPGPLPPQVETLETKLPQLLSLPTYSEVPLEEISADGWAKFRTGGVTPEAIPSVDSVADFLLDAAARRIPFKATAGLHHPIRSERALTYSANAPRTTLHGFINVFVAAAFAWQGHDRDTIIQVLRDEDPRDFEFQEGWLDWCGRSLSTQDIEAARRHFAHSFGSCSFEEPLADLRTLGWLP